MSSKATRQLSRFSTATHFAVEDNASIDMVDKASCPCRVYNMLFSKANLRMEAPLLEQSVHPTIKRDLENYLDIPPGTFLNTEEIRYFSASNAVYQHSTLL
jgi:hypothetical protein